MLFASYEFVFFLIAVIVLYYITPPRYQWCFLLFASYLFYFIADPRYLIFIAATTLVVWISAKKIADLQAEYKLLPKAERKGAKETYKCRQKRWLLFALFISIGILAVLKYTNFAIYNVKLISHFFGSEGPAYVDIVLPMGISFYTFQAVGYLIDVYYGKYGAEKSLFRFALFVSFFPQLVQGPISRYSDLSATLYEPHQPIWKNISFGIERILWGYFKKLVIADRVLVAVKAIIDAPETYTGGFVFIGMMFYALELYADFTGGIDITIGIAETMGIKVTENFIRPYFSKNIKEYWKRWHITMGTWFTDYIFFPLSVSKFMQKLNKFARTHFGSAIGKRIPVYVSSFVVWFATGIWHGASWNFIVWGLGNFVLIMISDELAPFYAAFHRRFNVDGTLWFKCFRVVRTVFLMSCLRLFDCYRDVPLTFRMLFEMFAKFRISDFNTEMFAGLGLSLADYGILLVAMMLLIGVSLIQRGGLVREKIAAKGTLFSYMAWFAVFVLIIVFGAYGIGYDESQFIYNQF